MTVQSTRAGGATLISCVTFHTHLARLSQLPSLFLGLQPSETKPLCLRLPVPPF